MKKEQSFLVAVKSGGRFALVAYLLCALALIIAAHDLGDRISASLFVRAVHGAGIAFLFGFFWGARKENFALSLVGMFAVFLYLVIRLPKVN